MRILTGIRMRVRGLLGRGDKGDGQTTRQERRIHAALERQEMERERGRAEGKQY